MVNWFSDCLFDRVFSISLLGFFNLQSFFLSFLSMSVTNPEELLGTSSSMSFLSPSPYSRRSALPLSNPSPQPMVITEVDANDDAGSESGEVAYRGVANGNDVTGMHSGDDSNPHNGSLMPSTSIMGVDDQADNRSASSVAYCPNSGNEQHSNDNNSYRPSRKVVSYSSDEDVVFERLSNGYCRYS